MMCLIAFLSTVTVSVEAMGDNIIEKRDRTFNKLTQGGIISIETEKTDKSKFSTSLIGFKTFGEKKEKAKETRVMTRNDKRLAHYKPRLDAYTPPEGEISILVTGYSSTPDQTWGDPFTTASGTRVHLGTMACPPQYPFGTKISIEGRGDYVCEDRGGAIKGSHFDMWFESRAEALHWGKRVVAAKIEK